MTANLLEGDTFKGEHYSWDEQSTLEETTSSGVARFEEQKALIQESIEILANENSTPEQKQEAIARIHEANETILRMYEECEVIIGEAREEFEDASIAHQDSNTEYEVEASKTVLEEFLKKKALAELNVSTLHGVLETLNKGHKINSESVTYKVEPDGDYIITGEAVREIASKTPLKEAEGTWQSMGEIVKHGKTYEIGYIEPGEQEIE